MQAVEGAQDRDSCDAVIPGAGHAGHLAALRLRKRSSKLRVILVNASHRFVEKGEIAGRCPIEDASIDGRHPEQQTEWVCLPA